MGIGHIGAAQKCYGTHLPSVQCLKYLQHQQVSSCSNVLSLVNGEMEVNYLKLISLNSKERKPIVKHENHKKLLRILVQLYNRGKGEVLSIIMDENKGRLSNFTVIPLYFTPSQIKYRKGNHVKLSFRDDFKTSTKFVQKLRELNKNKHMYVLDFK